MFNIIVTESYDAMSSEAYKIVKETLKKESPVLGLAAGNTPVGLYKKLIADHNANGTNYENVKAFALQEYLGVPGEDEHSFRTFMEENLYEGLRIPRENTFVPDGTAEDAEFECAGYDAKLRKYPLDLLVLGIGTNGHIAYNEPGTDFELHTHIAELSEESRAAEAKYFDDDLELVPKRIITMGIASLLSTGKILVLANGEDKADALYDMIKGSKSEDCPASALQDHPNVTVIVTQDAGKRL